jgi:glycosyltransferase involved in cell wall biosynthesis
MRIVIAGDFPDRPPNVIGGIQAVIFYTLLNLVHYPELDIHVVSCEKWRNRNNKSWIYQGNGWIAHYLLSQPRLPHSLTMLTTDRQRLRQVIRSLSPDLIHVHGQAAAYPWAAFDVNKPTVLTVHGINALEARIDMRGGWLRGQLRTYIWTSVERACIHRATDIIVISPYVEKVIRPLTHARFYYIENPVQSELFSIERDEINKYILYVGSIQKRKGLIYLIRAINQLKDSHPNIQLRVAGGFTSAYAKYEKNVRQLVKSLNLEAYIKFLGHLDRDALLEEYRHCNVFCLPSFVEASPVVVAEAMAAGCPIVTTTIDSTSHLIEDGLNGYRVPPGDPYALANGLDKVLANKSIRQQMGYVNRQIALARFSPEQAALATHKLYTTIISS